MKFGIIGEGITDQVVIEHILEGYYKDLNLETTRLQPAVNESGNWDKVGKYISSKDFQGAFFDLDAVVIQIDSDVFTRGEVWKQWAIDFAGLSVEQTVDSIRQFLISKITPDIYELAKSQIAFAIVVNCVECWFVPLYLDKTTTIDFTTADCANSIREKLMENHNFALTKNTKTERRHDKISKEFLSKEKLLECIGVNPSFDVFLKELDELVQA